MDVGPPALSSAPPLPLDGRAGRVLVYCPDAIGTALVRDFGDWFAPVRAAAPLAVELRSMVPPKTPVCFASMFTGAQPEAHGIAGPVRPVLRCDTLFDALVRAGKRVALVAVRGSSIDLIFRDRPLDYFSEAHDEQVTTRALALVAEDRHDLVVAYHQEYDDCLHRSTCRSPQALEAVKHHIAGFALLAGAANRSWAGHDRAVMFCPDHGGHDSDGRGTHGDDVPEDMEVTHFFGLARGR
jgi:hypothetical protein